MYSFQCTLCLKGGDFLVGLAAFSQGDRLHFGGFRDGGRRVGASPSLFPYHRLGVCTGPSLAAVSNTVSPTAASLED